MAMGLRLRRGFSSIWERNKDKGPGAKRKTEIALNGHGPDFEKVLLPKCLATLDGRGAYLALRGDRIELPAPSDEEVNLVFNSSLVPALCTTYSCNIV
jgi:hypothetical protein